ncbi:hypothetical protein Sant_P0096 (plasmid) [Sodalis praecaptivus]|uniref:Uncharacterized protein n=1 Tax=Sodalis praecaptivus TaxID=1239307 RepID=W0I311_9GAMM|nr:hypothetical protein [Sodalis praecaptivus]AHF79142.1 hypothetical protein Sant_P0096 [Sodalis praecaptivus]
MPKIVQSYQQHRERIGLHAGGTCFTRDNQKTQNEKLILLSREPGLYHDNYEKRMNAYALLQVIALLSAVQNSSNKRTSAIQRGNTPLQNTRLNVITKDPPVLTDFREDQRLQTKLIYALSTNKTCIPHRVQTYEKTACPALKAEVKVVKSSNIVNVHYRSCAALSREGIDRMLTAAKRGVTHLVTLFDFTALLYDPLTFPAAEAAKTTMDSGTCPEKIMFTSQNRLKKEYSFANFGIFKSIKLSDADLYFCHWIKHDPDNAKTQDFLTQELMTTSFSLEQLEGLKGDVMMVKICDDLNFTKIEQTLGLSLSAAERHDFIELNAKHFHQYCKVLTNKISRYQEDLFCLLKIPPFYNNTDQPVC